MNIQDGNWAALILGIRKKLNLSQTKFSKEIGLNRKSISRFEAFQRIPNNKSVYKIKRFIIKNKLDKRKLTKLGKKYINEYKNRQKVRKLNLDYSPELAELIGIILGDGEIRPDCVRISFDPKKDLNFIKRRVFYLINRLIGCNITFESKKRIAPYSMPFVRYLVEDCKIQTGSKSKNNSTVPSWCIENVKFRKTFVRGIFDTDGYIGYKGHAIEIQFGRFTDKCTNLVKDIIQILKYLEIKNSVRHTEDGRYVIKIVGQEEVIKFFRFIGSSNLKHIVRFLLWRIIKYPAKIEKEGLDNLVSKLNELIKKDVDEINIPFIWSKENTNFCKLINQDIKFLDSLKLRREIKWDKLMLELLKIISSRKIAKKLGIGERSIRRWREGTRIPNYEFVHLILKMSEDTNIDINSFRNNTKAL